MKTDPDAAISYYFEKNTVFGVFCGRKNPRMQRLAIIVMSAYLAAFGVCASSHALFLPSPHVGLVQDLVMWSLFPLLLSIVSLTFSLLRKLERLFDLLRKVITPHASDPDCFGVERSLQQAREFVALRSRRGRFCYWILIGVFFLLVLVFQIYVPIFSPQQVRSWSIWPQHLPVPFAFAVAWAVLVWPVIIANATWYGLGVCFTVFPLIDRYARDGRISIVPIAPDGRGGLSPIGDVLFRLILIASCGFLLLVPWAIVFGVDLPLVLSSCIYVAAVPSVFFVPLLSIYRAMKQARERELSRWAFLFKTEYDRLPTIEALSSDPCSANPENLAERMAYLYEIERLYARAESMPLWPFDLKTLRTFFVLMVIPLLLFIIQLVTENALTHIVQGFFK